MFFCWALCVHKENNLFTTTCHDRLRSSILNQSADDYVGYLQQHRYCAETVRAYVRGVEHFAYWLTRRRLAVQSIDDLMVRRFISEHLPVCKCPVPCQRSVHAVRPALGHLLQVLRREKYIPEPRCFPDDIHNELDRFDVHLDSICGLASSTRISRRMWVGSFLLDRFKRRPLQIAGITPGNIIDFMSRPEKRYSPGSLRVLGGALRSYLRFRAVSYGDRVDALLAAVPTVAQWRLATLPKHLTPAEIDQFLRSFDISTANGKRDYAMARCLVDMGLRAGEVACIQLNDLNWREGTLTIGPGKSRRADVMPLPVTTGKAIVDYLRSERPQGTNRALFLRHHAPFDVPITAETLRGIVRRAFNRSGLVGCRFNGTHALRHTAAMRMRCAGASLKEIADVLRHRSLDTTTIYTKVDLPALASISGLWPGGVS